MDANLIPSPVQKVRIRWPNKSNDELVGFVWKGKLEDKQKVIICIQKYLEQEAQQLDAVQLTNVDDHYDPIHFVHIDKQLIHEKDRVEVRKKEKEIGWISYGLDSFMFLLISCRMTV